MTVWKRLTRKPLTTLLWLLFVTLMTGFLSAAAALWYSTAQLAETLDRSHTAIAVRTDPGVSAIRGRKGVVWEVNARAFDTTDAEALAALDGVKAVRSHTVTGASSPSFYPIVGVQRAKSWRSPGPRSPYSNAVFAGMLVQKRRADTYYGMGVGNESDSDLLLLFAIDEVLLLNREYDEPLQNLLYKGGFSFRIALDKDPEAEAYFVEGERYVLGGYFDPLIMHQWNTGINGEQSWGGNLYFVLDAGKGTFADGFLYGQSRKVEWSEEQRKWLFTEDPECTFPAAEKLTGDAASFFETTPHEAWRTFYEAWQMQNHSVPVIGTDRLETVYQFLTGDAFIIDGRSFTQEEYETGAKVLIVSEQIAQRGEIAIGDRIPFSQYLLNVAVEPGASMHNPYVDDMRNGVTYTDAEPYTVVGIYRQVADWTYGAYAFSPNTVFMPRSAQISGGFGEILPPVKDGAEPADVYGLCLSLELVNGREEDFLLALEKSTYIGQFYAYDQGFEAVQRDLNGLALSASRLIWIAIGGWVLLLFLYLLMYQSAQKKNLGVMRSLGAAPAQATAYLFFGGFCTATLGIALGTVLSRVALGFVQERVLGEMLGAIDRTAYGGALLISEESIKAMVESSTPSATALVLLGGAELLLMSLLLLVHAAILSGRGARRLSED